ncbi:MAG: sulfite exporter TauE/SafE family protein [Litoreibacter sp.]|nr:sulfite exporter TauE/SafE family protein [Litoreibacter sp.]
MEYLISDLGLYAVSYAFAIALLAGVVKGIVGFAMPMILISGLTLFLPPEIALAGLIMPTLVTNTMQALRQGFSAAWSAIKRFRIFLLVGAVVLLSSAQLVKILPPDMLLLGIGIPITLFAGVQVLGWRPHFDKSNRWAETIVAIVAGISGGLSGVWGPPTVAYLTAINTPKEEQMRAQGVVYGLGAVLLVIAHVKSGVIRTETLPLSIALVVPAVIGTWLGFKIQDRVDQATFRKVTLLVVLIAGVNLVRRGLLG